MSFPFQIRTKTAGTLLALSVILPIVGCDTRKDPFAEPIPNLVCYASAACADSRGVRFGMVGDSWTDLVAGLPVVRTLRTYLEEDYGYHLVGATVGGQRLHSALNGGVHFQVIEKAGPDIRYMLISLGGNDFLRELNAAAFSADSNAEWERVFSAIHQDLLALVRTGNAYKMERWGGAEITWIVHGYDYINIDNPYYSAAFNSTEGCRSDWLASGFTAAQIDNELIELIDRYNERLTAVDAEEPYLRYIDLRGTLGGPPYSDSTLMVDCIHPDTVGFGLLSARYVTALRLLTNDER